MAGVPDPPGVDARIASPARIYDYMLGGHDNYQVDRDIGDQMIKLYPEAQLVLLENRRFLKRAVRYLAEEKGLRRFVDIGSGLPTQENVHEVAEQYAPGSQIVYVDNDQLVLTHAHALLRGENVVIIEGDLRDPEQIIQSPEVQQLTGSGEPVVLLLVAVLHFIKDSEDPYGAVARLMAAMPSGSYLVASHATNVVTSTTDTIQREYQRRASADLTLRDLEPIKEFFAGLDLVDPGVTWVWDWRPDGAERQVPGMYGGVARKP